MKNAEKLTIKYELIELMQDLNPTDFKNMIIALMQYSKNEADFPEFSSKATSVTNIIIKDFKNSILRAKCGAKGGNPHLKRISEAKKQREAIDKRLFEDFWREYPKKVGKQHAKRCFERLKPTRELTDKMLEALREHKLSDQWKDSGGKFIPHPATWLNQGRWMDEIQIERENKFKEMNIGVRI